jgi:hypothetical protein
MYTFAKKVLGTKVTRQMNEDEIFQMIIKDGKITSSPKSLSVRPKLTQKFMNTIVKSTNPRKYKLRTTTPKRSQVLKEQLVGAHTAVKDFKSSDGRYIFNLHKHKWVLSKNKNYIRNVMNYRPILTPSKFPNVPALYGYNKYRNTHMSNILIKKSSEIPLVGLKNTLDT